MSLICTLNRAQDPLPSRSAIGPWASISTIDTTARFGASISLMVGRRCALLLLLFAWLPACAGPNSRLVTVHPGGGSGAVEFTVKNLTDTSINGLHIAKTELVNAAGQNLEFDSPDGEALWGPDLLTHAGIGVGHSVQIDVPPGTWDVRALDNHRRYQHVTGLHLDGGGRYILELNDGGWRTK